MRHVALTLAATALAVCVDARAAEDIRFPEDAGVIDVTKEPYNARGDGRTDDTAALNKAIQAFPNGKVIVFLPKGTYLISDTLEWPKGRNGWEWKDIKLRGENRAESIIRLKDRCDGYQDPDKPKAMIWTGPPPEQRFHNAVENLTIDAGRRNPGATGLQFNASNTGRVVDVTIVGEAESAVGLDMAYCNQIGPLLVKNLRVTGFRIGIHTRHAIESQTFYRIELSDQGAWAWRNDGQVVSIQGLDVEGRGRAVYNGGRMTLLEARFEGRGVAAGEHAAIENAPGAMLYVRDLEQTGYAAAIHQMEEAGREGDRVDGAASAPGESVREWVAGDVLTLFSAPRRSLHLPIEDTPEVPWDPFDQWANVQDFGARVSGQPGAKGYDSREGIQKAMDSGKTTVYFPNNHASAYPSPRGGYAVSETPIRVRGKVRRVIGCEAALSGHPRYWLPNEVVIEDGVYPVVVIERLHAKLFRIKTNRTVVLKHLGGTILVEGRARVFIEDVVGSPLRICKGASVWARQFNPEMNKKAKEKWGPHVLNDGGTLWILGLKTEGGDTLVETKGGGRTEILGANNYSGGHAGNARPMYVNHESSVSIIAAEVQFAGPKYKVYVRETRGGQTRDLVRDRLPWNCGSGMKIPLYAGYVLEDDSPARMNARPEARALSPSSIELSWRDAEDDESGVSHYVVYRDGEKLAETKLTRYVDDGLPDDTSCRYGVSAVNGALVESRRARAKGRTRRDTTPPAVVSVTGGTDASTVIVTFTKTLDPPSASSRWSYGLSRGAQVTGAKLADDGRTVTLATSPLTDGERYELTVRGVLDRARRPNEVKGGTSVAFTFRSSGSGLKAEYFANTTFEGRPAVTRIEGPIDFPWGNGPPAKELGADNFSVRWTGSIVARRSGTYTFHATTDDGVRVWIDGVKIIDDWRDRAPTESRGEARLVAGKPAKLRIEYYERGGGAACKLEWSARGVKKEVVPKASLFGQ